MSTKISLKDMSVKDLTKLIDDAKSLYHLSSPWLLTMEQLAKTLEAGEAVKAKIADIAAAGGFEVGELYGKSLKSGSKSAGPRAVPNTTYVNPDNHEQKWNGRGRRPAWMIEKLNAGIDLETMAEAA